MSDAHDPSLKTCTIQFWKKRWDDRKIHFHEPIVNRTLEEQIPLVNAKHKIHKILVPLCGKSLDMLWMIDQGYQVVGVDGARQAVEEFFTDHGLEWTETDATSMGPGCRLLQNTERNIKLYYGGIDLFNRTIEGQFDFIWDRAAIVALTREAVDGYVDTMKDLLCPGGSMLIESHDSVVFTEDGTDSHPPPYVMYENEFKSLFEPECTVYCVDQNLHQTFGKTYKNVYYLVTKKTRGQ